MVTANTLVSGAIREVSSNGPGEGIPGEEADEALSALNSMLAGWGAAGGMAPARTLENFPVGAGVGSLSVGPTGQTVIVRPDYVHGVFLRDSSGQDTLLDVTMTAAEYNAIPVKTLVARPSRLFYDPQYPNGVLYLDRVTDAAYTLFLDSTKPFTQFSSLAATVNLPGEYEDGIKYLLAERLAPSYGFTIPPDLRKLIEDARRLILRKNTRPKAASFDATLRRPVGFNTSTGLPT